MNRPTSPSKTRKLVTHKEAKEKKLARYFTAVPCKNNHVAQRFTNNTKCVVCTTGYQAVQEQIASMARNHKAITEGTFVPPKT